MKTINFKAVENAELGGSCLVFANKRRLCNGNFGAFDGLVIAHDIVEHQQGPEAIGTVGDELIALGAVHHTRCQWGEVRRDTPHHIDPTEALAHDLTSLYETFEAGVPLREKMRTYRVGKRSDHSENVEGYIECFRETQAQYVEDWDKFIVFQTAARNLMNYGSLLSQRRFNKDRFEANRQFWAIECAVQDCIDQYNLDELCTMYARVQLRWGSGEATARVLVETDYNEWTEY